MWLLIFADDPADRGRLEAELEGTPAEAVDEMIEQSCWTQDVSDFVGGKGTAQQRLIGLRAAYLANNRPLGNG